MKLIYLKVITWIWAGTVGVFVFNVLFAFSRLGNDPRGWVLLVTSLVQVLFSCTILNMLIKFNNSQTSLNCSENFSKTVSTFLSQLHLSQFQGTKAVIKLTTVFKCLAACFLFNWIWEIVSEESYLFPIRLTITFLLLGLFLLFLKKEP
jgi:hypothetical protein